jgi:transcriptional regulator with XRE-family HTH domain
VDVRRRDTGILIGYNIRSARGAAKLSQSALATRLGVTQASVSLWETGSRVPNVEVLRRIAVSLGCSLNVLLRGL